jgi:hypothetical protein
MGLILLLLEAGMERMGRVVVVEVLMLRLEDAEETG